METKYYIEYVRNTNVILYESVATVATTYTKKSIVQKKNENYSDFRVRCEKKVIIRTLSNPIEFNTMLESKFTEGNTFEISELEFYKNMYDMVNSPY